MPFQYTYWLPLPATATPGRFVVSGTPDAGGVNRPGAARSPPWTWTLPTGRARLSYRRAAEVSTTTGWTLHQLRHTRIRELKDTGCPLPVLQKINGHRPLRTLTEHDPGPSPQAVQAWYDNTDPDARRPRPG